jgi:uncharacterized protein YukE
LLETQRRRERNPDRLMINYDTASMHATGKTIQSNGHELQSNLQQFWSFYQTDMNGGFPAFTSCLTDFMDLCQGASSALAQNRVDIGTTLDQAATAAEQEEAKLRQSFIQAHTRMPE